MDTSMASSPEDVPVEAKDDIATSTMNTIGLSHTTETISLDGEQERRQEADGIKESEESSSIAEDPTEVIARGIASVLGPVIKTFETRVEEVVKSQHTLENSIDRLTRELDKLLEDTPLPLGAQHAAKLSGIRKRVGSLSDTLRIVQGRVNSMETMLSDPSVNLSPK
ncbi:hypothetical protein Mapa_005726 [Marchantia paleacea]|nr:hypothetical protein Mapa_005726 [Marchantia paleacea]